MMTMRKLMPAFGLLLCLLAMPAYAVLPENGVYYNPDAQGVGYSIEVQGTTLVMLTFAHDKDTGEPLYYYSAGTITQARPGLSTIPIDPPLLYEHEYPYQFDAPIYRFTDGPCVTCTLPDWNTAEHAVEVGHVHLRMADVNRITATFTLADGSSKTTELRRMGFGRAGYDLGRDDGRMLPDMRGEWVFADRAMPDAPVTHFNFTEVEPPSAWEGSFYGRDVHARMRFTDPAAGADLTCTRYGCALSQDGETLFLVKFQDIGMDSLLGYKGDELFSDDGTAFQYRTGDLVIGKHMIDPIPEAAPPPES
ncbi:MAG TPA: hypothetical protein VFG73_00620 [Rhodanobacteraceae bacterium]|nr:hypothetical protein [Rhodanobacteraceae bacterium]